MNIKKAIYGICYEAIGNLYSFPPEKLAVYVTVTNATRIEYGHYQCNSAMKLSKAFAQLQFNMNHEQRSPLAIAHAIKDELEKLIAKQNILQLSINVVAPGFINFTLTLASLNKYLCYQLQDPRLGVEKIGSFIKTIIDFSSPNIAKEMHVGHLRSTIIGDCIARTLEFLGYDVLRLNHVGDWGTPFGMLIHYLKSRYLVDKLKNFSVQDLVVMYQEAKKLFDLEPEFKRNAQLEVVKLQGLEDDSLAIWQELCEISMKNYQQIYDLLDVKIITRGESFYNSFLADVVDEISKANLVTISDGAKCVYFPEFKNRDQELLPLIIQKQDGGYNYDTTDLAAIRYRTQQEYSKWIIYVTDAGQSLHFSMVFACARLMGWLKDVRVDHVPFGLVLNQSGGKMKTREGKATPLLELINTAIERAREKLLLRYSSTDEEIIAVQAKILGINAIKYADLSNNRITNYVFNYDNMLSFEGNTAAFLLYAYVRINSILHKVDSQALVSVDFIFNIEEIEEQLLAIALLQFVEVCEQFVHDLLPHRLCDYLFMVADRFHKFFHNCRVDGHENQHSRIGLCILTKKILEQGFSLLGLKTLDKM